ncbi:BTB/POZ domain-containing protein KCTD8 [Sarcoptes scabiei]|uniref:BTB/POZ domain-containing protein KCTD8 n=1 Tax=Sarcoptes scabiei TaxID=52283 RepID=A0A834R8J4_SARSC|nr:BTB/POZ domain-containing protein KCTD8 [Sarcoptes scabiei]UXI22162.1 hypothetical protein NH340_JMT08105 [Sarcoptes scabiei]
MVRMIQLNVGGQKYVTELKTLMFDPNSRLAKWFQPLENNPVRYDKLELLKDDKGRFIIDRDGSLFRYVLNYLRSEGAINLPEHFTEHRLLRIEAEFFGLDALAKALISPMPRKPVLTNDSGNSHGGYGIVKGTGGPGYITVGYRGSFAMGRDGLADVKFRKLTKILVAGRVALCREIFGDTLNESRDPDHCDDNDRYTARFFLKHLCLEQAFDCLQEAGFHMVGSCGSSTSNSPSNEPMKPGIDAEETRWNHYNEFVFCRP